MFSRKKKKKIYYQQVPPASEPSLHTATALSAQLDNLFLSSFFHSLPSPLPLPFPLPLPPLPSLPPSFQGVLGIGDEVPTYEDVVKLEPNPELRRPIVLIG